MNEHISIILGSGFSAPEHVPTVRVINERMRQLREDEFFLGSDQTAFFYRTDWRDPNAWMPGSYNDRLFAQEFVSFYSGEVLKNNFDAYNYEEFFDYISEFLRFQKHKEEIEKFCQHFRETFLKKGPWLSDSHNLVWRFSQIFSQLVAGLLTIPRYHEDVSYANYPPYDAFISFLKECLVNKVVNVHTSNHDLFFDMLARKHVDLWQHFCDGFTEYGSPYFGEVSFTHTSDLWSVHKTYNVRLRYYNDDFNKGLRLFKLHGSIDNYILILPDTTGGHIYSKNNSARVKKEFAVGEFHVERLDEKLHKYFYENPFSDNYPDFLTGTTEKIRQYHDPFYENLFNYFKSNLMISNQLLVIGYGFQDTGINEYIENHYLIFNKPMTVIDIRKPNHYIFEKYNDQITFINKGITSVSYKEFIEHIK